jgi:tRNA nucleotidyltransferase (CCA-adding enzyme)
MASLGLDHLLDQLALNQRAFLPAIAADLSPVLSPESWPFALEWLPSSACLVGGSVRDALLGRQSDYLDLDFVLPEGAVETAEAIARHYKAGFVLLDAERQIARVVFPQGTADFAQQVGPTLESDLWRRDFTVNAIAYNPHTDQLLDPLQGYADLQKRLIRMVSPVNLAEDPLRLLRAYRQAAQLGFKLDPETRAVVRDLAPRLSKIAAERVQSEINYLLSTAKGTFWLTAAWQDGVLRDWFPGATAESLLELEACDRSLAQVQEVQPEFAAALGRRIRNIEVKPGGSAKPVPSPTDPKVSGSGRTWLFLAKLTCLLAGDPATAELQMRRLKYSRNEIQAVGAILRFLPTLHSALMPVPNAAPSPALDAASPASAEVASPQCLSRRSQFLFFQNVGVTFPAIALRVLALGVPMAMVDPLIARFLTVNDPVAHPTPLLTGQDLMTGLGLSPGPQVGYLLAEIQLARADEQIHTAAEALQLAQRLLQQPAAEGRRR